MKIAICDNDDNFIKYLYSKISFFLLQEDINFKIDTFKKAEDLLNTGKLLLFDLIFADSSLPKLIENKLEKDINKEFTPIIIVFISGLFEVAPMSLEANNIFRYLPKKQIKIEFNKCMSSILKIYNCNNAIITINSVEGKVSVDVREIAYIKAEGHTLYFHFKTHNAEKLVTRKHTLKELQIMMPNDLFVRIDHSVLVNLSFVENLQKDLLGIRCVLLNKMPLYISQRKYLEVKNKYYCYKSSLL